MLVGLVGAIVGIVVGDAVGQYVAPSGNGDGGGVGAFFTFAVQKPQDTGHHSLRASVNAAVLQLDAKRGSWQPVTVIFEAAAPDMAVASSSVHASTH